MLSFFFRHGLVVTINTTDEPAAKARAEEIAALRFKDAGMTEEPSLSGIATLPKDGIVVTWDRKNDTPTQAEINIVETLTTGVQIKDQNQEHRERMERCRKFGDITRNGVVFDWWLASAAGAGFLLFREPHHTDDDIKKAKDQLHADRDVVGAIKVQQVK